MSDLTAVTYLKLTQLSNSLCILICSAPPYNQFKLADVLLCAQRPYEQYPFIFYEFFCSEYNTNVFLQQLAVCGAGSMPSLLRLTCPAAQMQALQLHPCVREWRPLGRVSIASAQDRYLIPKISTLLQAEANK